MEAPKTLKPLWFRLTKKTFDCPQCGQRLRVPIRPGKTLRVNCVRCPSMVYIDFRLPFIEVFKWQSGKSLKQNLVDMHHRFWNLSLQHKIQILIWVIVLAMTLDLILGLTMGLYSNFNSQVPGAAPSELIESTIRRI